MSESIKNSEPTNNELHKWRSGFQHLPRILRDFHAQKSLFKAIELAYGRFQFMGKDLDWVQAQIYTFDYFLWFMAERGYVLKRSSQKLPFKNIDEVLHPAPYSLNIPSQVSESAGLSAASASKAAVVDCEVLSKFIDYVKWTPAIWLCNPEDQFTDTRHLHIMCTGLSGETGEVCDALMTEDGLVDLQTLKAEQRGALIKELGDVIYYWAIVAHTVGMNFDIELDKAALLCALEGAVPKADLPIERHLLRLTAGQGRLAEFFKKYVRDHGTDLGTNVAVRKHLFEFVSIWAALVLALGLSIEEVVLTNKAKLLSRMQRGTMQGSGDSR